MGGLVIEARVQIFPDNIQRTKYRPIGPRKRALYANAKRPRKFDFRRALFGDLGFWILISPGFGLALGAPHVLWSRKGTAGKNQTKARSPGAAIATELAALSRCACGALLNFFVASVDGVHLRAGPVGIEW